MMEVATFMHRHPKLFFFKKKTSVLVYYFDRSFSQSIPKPRHVTQSPASKQRSSMYLQEEKLAIHLKVFVFSQLL